MQRATFQQSASELDAKSNNTATNPLRRVPFCQSILVGTLFPVSDGVWSVKSPRSVGRPASAVGLRRTKIRNCSSYENVEMPAQSNGFKKMPLIVAQVRAKPLQLGPRSRPVQIRVQSTQ